MERDEFIKKAVAIKSSWLDKSFKDDVCKILDSGCIDLENIPDNYCAVYPVLAAIANKFSRNCINGRADLRKELRNIEKFY